MIYIAVANHTTGEFMVSKIENVGNAVAAIAFHQANGKNIDYVILDVFTVDEALREGQGCSVQLISRLLLFPSSS